jgi:hypothetical protein
MQEMNHKTSSERQDDQLENLPRGPHEPPRITRLGTIQELTLGSATSSHTDGTFPGSIFG